MANKPFNTRIQLKHDTEAHYDLATNFKPLAGELIIYDVDTNNSSPRLKVGDGSTVVSNLPFINMGGGSGVSNLIVVANNSSASDAITTTTSATLTDGQIVYLFLSAAMAGSAAATISFNGGTAIGLYLQQNTPLQASFSAGTLLQMLYYNNKLYVVNAPTIV